MVCVSACICMMCVTKRLLIAIIIMITLTINKIRWYHATLHCRFWRHYICRSIVDHVHAHLLCASPHWRLSRLSTTYALKKYIAVLICRKAWAQLPCTSITVRNLFFRSLLSKFAIASCSGSNLAALARYRSPFYVSRFRHDISACVSIEVRPPICCFNYWVPPLSYTLTGMQLRTEEGLVVSRVR